MNKRLSQAEFLTSATSKHGDRYDYSKVHYTKSDATVTIICKEHGEFEQTPASHLGGSGCEQCGREFGGLKKRGSNDEFIEKAIAKHGDRYDYSKANYTKSNVKMTIICKEHGEFEQTPNGHLDGRGCEACGRTSRGLKQRCTNDAFVEKSKEKHGDRYDYSKVNYTKSDVKVSIVCKEHGEFEQTPESHLGGSGCEQCGRESSGLKHRGSNDAFIEKAIAKHGDIYDYSKVHYTQANEKVIIICKHHGEFAQTPNKHLGGCGCRRCGNSGHSNVALEWLRYLQLAHPNIRTASSSDGEFRIPSTKYRADGYCEDTRTVFEFQGDFWHGNPKYYPRDAFNPITKSTFGELFERTQHKKSTIVALGFSFVEIWERDWRNVIKTIVRAQVRWRRKSQVIRNSEDVS
jgi:protein-arginine kinase activator protein McsA